MEFLNTERALLSKEQLGSTLFTVLRLECMVCTENSCFEMPESTYLDAPSGIDYLIEFIGVEDTPSYLEKYSSLMRNYYGPANGELVERGILHCFVALETREVLYQAPGEASWNQIHISDHWNVIENMDWDSLYVELFRSMISCELDSVSAEFPPFDYGVDTRGHLISDF